MRRWDSPSGSGAVATICIRIRSGYSKDRTINFTGYGKETVLFDGRGVGDVRRQCFADPFLGDEIRYPAPAEEQEGQPSFFSGRCRKPEIDLSSGQGAGNDPRRSCPLSETNKGTISRDAELLERLQRVRALLEEVRAELKESAEDRAVVAEIGAGEAAEVSALPVRTRKKPAAQELADDAGGDGAESKGPVQVIEPGPRSEKPAPKRSAARQPRRKKEKEEAESKELFAFYEQSLF